MSTISTIGSYAIIRHHLGASKETALYTAIGVTLAAGLIKELTDRQGFDGADMGHNLLGTFAGSIPIVIIEF